MITIEDISKIDLNKIENEKVRSFAKDLINDFKEAEDKEKAAEIYQGSVDKVYQMIRKYSPESLILAVENPCEEVTDEKKEKPKAKKNTQRKSDTGIQAKPSEISKRKKKKTPGKKPEQSASKLEINELEEEVKACRVKMKIYREEKRKLEKPKPAPTRYAKIKGHFISLGNLIPENLEDKMEVQKQSKKLLKNTHRNLLKIYRMNAIRGQKDNEELKERLDKIEEKLESK